jgi:hypothetical protein
MSDDDKKVPAMPGNKNAFERFADDADSKWIVGDLLKFVKGDWLVGRDGEELTEKELVAIVPGLVHGAIRWEDNRPVEQIMGLLLDGFTPPKRSELGYHDKTAWKLDAKGKPDDPWKPGLYLPMVTVNGERVFTFATGTDGGIRRGVAPLSREYGKHVRAHPDELPVVGLGQDSYLHSDRSIGRVKYPTFPIARYVEGKPYLDAIAAITGRPVNLLPGGRAA